jgi:hypothetical protein
MKTTEITSKKIFVSISIVLLLTQCSKQDVAPTSSTITYVNDTSTPVKMVAGGQTQMIDPGKSLVFTGKPGASLTGSASTSGVTTTNKQVGGLVSWTVNDTYPASGNLTQNFDALSEVFFLEIVNNSAYTFTKVYVNYGFTSQTLDNISIPNDGNTYNIGYYKAYTNTNVRVESSNGGYAMGNISLPFTSNQTYTFSVN